MGIPLAWYFADKWQIRYRRSTSPRRRLSPRYRLAVDTTDFHPESSERRPLKYGSEGCFGEFHGQIFGL